ncbi:20583_t:CDS:2 [Rhizophagus irregularis]|nr:20583_t:CDS:2 [Rhizophagus irregularis]
MSRNSSVYFILWILIQIFVRVNCQMTPFKPSVYNRHTATLIDNKLYILGGYDLNIKRINEFFYLDVSVPFNTQELSWQDLSNINMVPPHSSAASVKGGPNNDTLFLYGGASTDQTMALVYTFDSQRIVWSVPKIAGVNTIRKRSLTGIINNDGRMYLWSGETNTDYVNEMLILDTINLNWSKGSIINAPTPRMNYGAVLLPNNKIIYIGGDNDVATTFDTNTLNIAKGTTLTLSEIYIYDLINDNWDTKVTSGKIPSNRADFSAILGLDGKRIIIFGGIFTNTGYLDTTLYVLDLANYNWYIPKISGKIPNPRALHKANVIGKYMVVSFGYGYDKTVESDILLLDISNTAGIVVGSLLSGILLSVGKEKELPIIRDIHNYEQDINNNEQETIQIDQIPRNESTSNYEPIIIPPPIINKNNYHKQEIILTPENENTTNHEPIIIPVNDHHGQEIMQTLQNENTSDHEPTIPAPAVVNTNNYKYGQEVISTPNNNRISSQIFKDEILQAVKNEIGQNLKNELLQAVKNEIGQNLKNELLQAVREDNLNITRNNTNQD